jgi:hypothetical protein
VSASSSSLARCERTSWPGVNPQTFGHLEARGAAESNISSTRCTPAAWCSRRTPTNPEITRFSRHPGLRSRTSRAPVRCQPMPSMLKCRHVVWGISPKRPGSLTCRLFNGIRMCGKSPERRFTTTQARIEATASVRAFFSVKTVRPTGTSHPKQASLPRPI